VHKDLITKNMLFEDLFFKLRGEESFYIIPDIPDKLIDGAIKKYAKGVSPEDVILLFDASEHGDGTDGFLFTPDKFHILGIKKPLHYDWTNFGAFGMGNGYVVIDDNHIATFPAFPDDKIPDVLEIMQQIIFMNKTFGNISTGSPSKELDSASKDAGTDWKNPKSDKQISNKLTPFAELDEFQEFLDKYRKFEEDLENFYLRPNIDPAKLNNAIAHYAPRAIPDEAVVLIDNSEDGSASEGILITENRLYSGDTYKTPISVNLDVIRRIKIEDKVLSINEKTVIDRLRLDIDTDCIKNIIIDLNHVGDILNHSDVSLLEEITGGVGENNQMGVLLNSVKKLYELFYSGKNLETDEPLDMNANSPEFISKLKEASESDDVQKIREYMYNPEDENEIKKIAKKEKTPQKPRANKGKLASDKDSDKNKK
jgi:hypothetical protein